MTRKQTPLTMCHASAAAQTASRQRGTAPVRVCCKKDADGLEPEHPEADERPPPEVGVIEPLTAFDQQRASASETAKVKRLNR